MRAHILLAILLLCMPLNGHAVDASLDVSEATLNRLIHKIGILSDGGVTQPYNVTRIPGIFEDCVHVGFLGCGDLPGNIPGFGGNEIPLVICRRRGGGVATLPIGDPVPYQWWITDTALSVDNGSMRFTATVTTQVDGHWETTARTVGAVVRWEPGSSVLRLVIDNFQVPLVAGSVSLDVPPVDVSRFFSVSIPIVPQQFNVLLPDGATRTLNGRVQGATYEYTSDNLKVNFDVTF